MKAAACGEIDWWPEAGDFLTAVLRALPNYLLHQRWYPGKGAGPARVTLRKLLPLPVPNVTAALASWHASVPGSVDMEFFLPVARLTTGDAVGSLPVIAALSDGAVIVDALGIDSFVQALLRLMADGDPSEGSMLEAGHTSAFANAAPFAEQSLRRTQVEQSNTSIRVGDTAMLKVFRKLAPGIHPELEMGRFLTEQAHFPGIATLLGWLRFDGRAVAVLQAFVPNDGDGWTWMLRRLEGDPGAVPRTLPWIHRLGIRTAQLHRALATATGNPDFDPAPAQPEDWQRWTAGTKTMATRVGRALTQRHDELDEFSRSLAAQLDARMAALVDFCKSLADGAAPVPKTRHHGDYHLGQVLVSGDEDVTIVDFEGEPSRSVSERRAKQIPLRDVAGMLRSFGYAAAVAGRVPASAGAPHTPADPRNDDWLKQAERTFLDAYFATRSYGAAERAEAHELIRFFSIEKALYEVLYEIDNRPRWAAIPLRDLVSLLEQLPTPMRPTDDPATSHRHLMPFGAQTLPDGGGVSFRFWAPKFEQVQLVIDDAEPVRMDPVGEGWHALVVPGARPGSRYRFLLPDGLAVPDPASRFQPDDVHGPSEVIDPTRYAWDDAGWQGRPWHATVIYELHVGTFTAQGTFRAAMQHLDYLRDLGITAIEIMPIGDFPGVRNWGYDGVMPYAPDSSYGRPEDFKAFIDAAHQRGLQVFLDVIYNHFGPDGNFLPAYAPGFFTDRHKTPWGAGINFDGTHSSAVREFVIHNALYWLEEYRLDGLRLDAVHAILDDGEVHVLEELAARTRALGRAVHLILENEENKATLLRRGDDGIPALYTAQWNDDVHHVLHVAATGESQGYYADYRDQSEYLGRALAEGFAFQGQVMSYRGSARGEPSASLPPTAFVAFIQNHDQIGNRAFGERLGALATPAAIRAITAVYLLLPQIPLLFMGEEWGATQPFPFFSNFGGELAEAVRKGRRQEFARFPEFQDEEKRARIPDPEATETFLSAKLHWDDLASAPHAAWHDYYRRLLAERDRSVVPLLGAIEGNAGRHRVIAAGAVSVQWAFAGGELQLAANLSAVDVAGFSRPAGRSIWREGPVHDDGRMGPWSVAWSVLEAHA